MDRIEKIKALKTELKQLTDQIKAEAAALKSPRKPRQKKETPPAPPEKK